MTITDTYMKLNIDKSKILTITSYRNSHHGINMFRYTSCWNRNTHEIDTVTTCASCVCIYRLSLLSLSSWHGLFLDRLFEDRRRGGINTRDLMYVKFCWSFYLNCPLDRENSLYKAFKRRTKDIWVVHFLVTITDIIMYTNTQINYKSTRLECRNKTLFKQLFYGEVEPIY